MLLSELVVGKLYKTTYANETLRIWKYLGYDSEDKTTMVFVKQNNDTGRIHNNEQDRDVGLEELNPLELMKYSW